jgi:uncharacterized protein with PhoU and TrkA domain
LIGGFLKPVLDRFGDKYIFNPSEDEELKSGDALIFIGETNNVREIKILAGC